MTDRRVPRGGKSGRSVAPRKTVYRDKTVPALWQDYLDSLKAFRESKGMSIRDVAEAMGVSISLVSLWEKGVSTPHPHDFCVYLDTIGVKRIRPE